MVTGLLTAGLVLVALWEILRSRRQERRGQSQAVVSTHTIRSALEEVEHLYYHINVWNYSERPIFNLSMLYFGISYKGPIGFAIYEGESPQRRLVLLPRDNWTPSIDTTENLEFLALAFEDVRRNAWLVDLLTNELNSER